MNEKEIEIYDQLDEKIWIPVNICVNPQISFYINRKIREKISNGIWTLTSLQVRSHIRDQLNEGKSN
jgi:hypothetical protein